MNDDKARWLKSYAFKSACDIYVVALQNRKAARLMPEQTADELYTLAMAIFDRGKRIGFWDTYEESIAKKKAKEEKLAKE